MKRIAIPAAFLGELRAKATLEADVARTSDALQKYPRGDMGLTPDAVKATPEWKRDKDAFDAAMASLRKFNASFLKSWKKEYRQHIQDARASKAPNP